MFDSPKPTISPPLTGSLGGDERRLCVLPVSWAVFLQRRQPGKRQRCSGNHKEEKVHLRSWTVFIEKPLHEWTREVQPTLPEGQHCSHVHFPND